MAWVLGRPETRNQERTRFRNLTRKPMHLTGSSGGDIVGEDGPRGPAVCLAGEQSVRPEIEGQATESAT